jgi:parallel beta-helix repeat protein
MSKRRGLFLAVAAGILCLVPAASGVADPTPPTCDLVAAPNGSDSGPGTLGAPFQTAQKLVTSLQPGQTGCLRAGTYTESVTFRHGGTASAPVTLTSYPGESATVVGRIYVAEGADYTTITGLNLDGVNAARQQSPMIDANHVTFSYDDVTNDHTSICFGIGSATWGWSTGTLITHSRIHDCGVLPATNYQHGFYIGGATDTTIEWNLIYANADRGIQLYPEADYTTIDHNIIDDNGEGIIISGTDGVASSYTNVYDNVVSDSNQRDDVQSWWPAGNPVGVGNTVHDNCVWGGRQGTIDTSGGGFTAQDNLDVNPQFANAATHDYQMSAASPCLALVGDVQAAVDGTTPTVPSTSNPPSGSGNNPSGGDQSGDPGSSGSPGSPASGSGALTTPPPATTPSAPAAPATPTSHPKPTHTTRKIVRHRRKRRRPKRPAKPAARRPAKRSGRRPPTRPAGSRLRRLP